MAFVIKQGDTSPDFVADLKHPDKSVVVLTGATVKFHMRSSRRGSTPVVGNASIVNDLTGTVKYEWAASDTASTGDYEVEFEVTFADGKIETYPNEGYLDVSIDGEIA
jgi:hypothetical protein